MLRQRNSLPILAGLGVWLAIAAILLYTNLASAQQTSTDSLTAEVGEGVVELRWNAVSGAVSYEVHAWWTDDPGWQRLDDGGVTGTAYTHRNPTLGDILVFGLPRGRQRPGATARAPLPVRDRVRGRYTHANAHGHASTRGHSNSNADSHSHSNTDKHAHASTGGHSDTN